MRGKMVLRHHIWGLYPPQAGHRERRKEGQGGNSAGSQASGEGTKRSEVTEAD